MEELQWEERLLPHDRNRHADGNYAACESALHMLSQVALSHDMETGKHARRVQEYVIALTTALKLNPKYSSQLSCDWVRCLVSVVPLYDIGMIGIPNRILLKTKRFTSGETIVMKTHCQVGFDIIAATAGVFCDHSCSASRQLCTSYDSFQIAKDVALRHHEHWDGSGYPDRLAGGSLPLAARIVAVADAFDAMTSVRGEKARYTVREASEQIISQRGGKFDPDIVDAFVTVAGVFAMIAASQSCHDPGRTEATGIFSALHRVSDLNRGLSRALSARKTPGTKCGVPALTANGAGSAHMGLVHRNL